MKNHNFYEANVCWHFFFDFTLFSVLMKDMHTKNGI